MVGKEPESRPEKKRQSACLKDLSSTNARAENYHIICHSHGGSVCWEA